MANKWNQQEQGAKRRRSNQGTRGTARTQPAASNPNKNTKSTDTNRNSGRTVAAKPAPKAAPKQTKPKTVYFRSKDDAKPVYRNPAKAKPKTQKPVYYSKDNARPVSAAEYNRNKKTGNVRQTIGGAVKRAVQANASAAKAKPAFRSRDYGKEQIKRPSEMNVTDYAWQTMQQDQKAEHNLSNQRKARQMYVESGQAALQRDLAKLDMRSGSDRRGKSAMDRLSIDYKTGKWYWDGKEMTQAQFDQQFPLGLSDPTAREMAEKAGYIVNTRYFSTKEDEKDRTQEIGWVANNLDKYAGMEADNVSDADEYDLLANRRKYEQAKAAGDMKTAEKYHQMNEAIRAKYGYSGGAAGDQVLRGNVSVNEYAQLNETGDAALSNARRRLVNARTPAERERIQKEIDWILTNPENQAGEENKHQIRDLTKGSVLSSIGNTAVQLRNIRDMNKYAGADDAYNAVPKLWQRVSELYDQMGNTTDEKQQAKIQKQIDWLTDQATAMEQEQEKWATDPNSPYFDPTVAERLGMPTSVQPNRWDEMAERGDQLIAGAKEGMNAGQSFAADLYSNAIQMIPTTAAGLIPGLGGASVGAKLWNAARAATQTAALTQMGLAEGGNRYRELVARGVPEEQARTDALMSTAISIGTESVPLHYLGKLVSGTQRIGRTIPGAIASSFALEGAEEGVSYAANALWSWMRGYEQDRFDWGEMGKSMLAGGIMGGLHAGLGVAVNRAVTHLTSQGREQDANRVQAYMDDIDGIMEQSRQYEEMVRQGALSAEEGAAIQSQLQQDLVNKIQSIRDNVQTINDYQSMADQGVISQAEADQIRDTYGESITGQQASSREELERVASQRLYQAAMAENSMNTETPAQAEARQAAERTGRVQGMYQRGQSVMGAYQADREAQLAREIREAQQTEPVETVSTANPVEEAQRMTDEALRQKDNALRQAAEARARAEAVQNVMPVQEARQTMADAANQRLESISGTMGEKGSQALMTMAGEMNNTTAVRDFVRVYNQALMGNTGIEAPRSMTQAEFNRATEAGIADRMAGITLDLNLSEKAAGRNKNAGVNWSDSYVKGMDRQTAKTLDAYAKTIGAKIEFTEFTGANGSFVRSGNVITIAKDNPLFREDPVLFVMGHESTHRMQDLDVKSYNAFRDYVMSLPGSNEALEETLATYRNANAFKPGENQRYAAIDEVTADYAGRLLRDHEELRQFIRDMQQPKVLRALLKAFRAVRDVLTGRQKAQADEAVRLLEEAIKGASARVKETGNAEKGNKNTAREGGVKKLFSLSAPVEETETLVALHNLNETKMGKALDLGGFPMPSIAVTRKDIPHTNFGDISLVMSRDTIDPKKSRKNTVYSADAWTPTFPSIEYEADSKVENRIYRELTRLLDGVDSNVSGSAWQYASNLSDMLNRHGGAEGLIDAAANSLGMQAAYVRSKGVDIPGPETKETVTRMEPGFIDLYDTIINTLGEEAVRNIRKPDSFLGTGSAWRKQWQAENGEKLKAALKAHNRKRTPGLSEEQLEADINGMSLLTMHTLVRDASDYLRNGPEKRSTTTDYSKMQETIRDAVDQEGFRAWLEDLYDGVVKDSGVYNNKDLYTPSGNRRTFKQTHVPATLDNIAKVMASQNGGSTKNVSGFHGIKTLRAGTAKRFKSIKEMHEMEGRLQHLTPEEAKQISDALSDRMVDIMNRISGEDSGDFFSHMTKLDAIGETLMEVAESENYTIDNIVKTFGKYQYNVNNGLAQDIKELLFDVSQMPVNIFEAKPERAVRFDEVLAAVVPSDMDAGLRSRMEEAGMRLVDYERDNEKSRIDAVNSVEGARFSITPQADADYMAAVESGDMETAQRMVDEAAKAAGYTIKAYHGTAEEFSVFDDSKINSVWGINGGDLGFYFTPYEQDAKEYASYASGGKDGIIVNAYLKIDNPLVDEDDGWGGAVRQADMQNGDLKRWAKSGKHDGIIVRSTDIEMDDGPDTIYIVFSSDQIKSADPVTYDDDGNVIPLSERFNAETGDIRHSIGTEGYDRARLMRENQMLKEKLDYWRGQVKKSDRTKADPKEVRKLAKSLRADYSTDMDAGEITQRLQAIYDGIGKDWSYDRAYEEAGKLARDMIEQATATEDYLYTEYEPMRKFFQDTPLVVTKEMQRAIPDYNEWRKPLFGKLRLKGGEQTNVDQVFQEAVERWPEWFSEEVSANSLDQLDRIAEVMGGIYSRDEVNPFGYDIAGPAGYLTTQIMDSFWDVPSIKKTFADRAEARLGREVTRRLDMKERYENALQKVREQRDRKLREQSQRYLTAKRKNSKKQKERELRAKIQRHVNKLSTKLTRPTDTQHIPEDLIPTVRTALESINLASKDMKDTKRTQAFAALQKMYQEMEKNGSEVVIDPDLLPNISDIIGFADTPIANLGLEDLNTIWQTVRAIEASISTFNKALGRAKFETISQPAFGIRDYLTGRKDRGDYRGPFRQMDKLLNFNMLTPEAYFLRMGNSGKEVFRMLRDAQDRHITIMDQAQRKTKEIIGKTDIRKLEKEKHTFTFDGETVELTTAQIMSLYELMKRQQAVDHVMIGGIRPESVKKGIKDLPPARPWHLTQDQVSEVVDSLTPEQVKLADELQKYMGGTMAELGNEASMEVYGYRKFTEKHYFPISVDKNQTQSDVKNDAVSGTIAGWGSARPVKPNANNAVILRSIFDVYADHTTEMANYASWLAPMENMNRIFNFRYKDAEGNQTGTMKAQLETLFGKNGEAYWRQLQADLNNGVHGRDDSPFSALMGTYKASAIGANIRVIAQQPTAILRAMDSINPADFVAGMARARWGKFDKVVKQYAPIAIWKDWGYFQQDTGRQMRNVLFNDDTNLQKANSAMMWGAGKADSLSWTAIWNALENETRRKRKDLRYKSREFYEAVAERFNEVVDHTQVVDGILQRSQIMRSADGLTKMATSFMAEPTKTYNMMLSAIYEARNAKGRDRSAAMGKLAKTAFALTVSITVNAAAQSLVDAIRDDDKDEDYWEKFIQAYFGLEGDTRKEQIKNGILNGNLEAAFNPLTYIPYLKDIVSQTQGYSVSRMDMDTISRVLKAFTNVEKAMSGEGKNTKQSAWLNLTAEIARFLGVPAANIKRDIQTITRTFFAGTGNYRMLYEQEKFLYNIEGTGNFSEFAKLAYLAKRDGDTEAYEAIRADLIANGPKSEKDVDKKIAELEKKAVTDTKEFQTALAQKTDAYHTMLEADARFNGLDEDKQENVRKRLNDYAQYQVLGQSMDVENDKMEKIADAESHKVPAADWVVFTAAADAIEADYKPDGTLIQGSKKKKVVALIDSYDIPNEGKSYMYLSQGYSEKDNPYQ